jgi:hypothetical protein
MSDEFDSPQADSPESAGNDAADGYVLDPGTDRAVEEPSGRSREVIDLVKAVILADADQERRFSLAGLLAVVTLAALVLGIGTHLSPAVFAGVTGLAALLGMVALAVAQDRWAIAQLAWWVLFAIYLLATARAIWL